MKRVRYNSPALDEQHEGPKPHATDYSPCIIFQKVSNMKLYNVTLSGLSRLTTAAEAQQDEPAIRLEQDLGSDTSLQEKAPLWHAKYKNIYTLEKSFKLAKKRRIGEASASSLIGSHSSECPTHSSFPKADLKSQSIICNRVYDCQGKQPKSLVAADSWQKTLLRKTQTLNDHALLLRIQGYSNEAIDKVANDVCYHKPCMNRYIAQ